MALRDFLYPQLEVQLILARALDVDEVQAGQGSLSKEYQNVTARVSIAIRDAQRLGLEDGNHVEVSSEISQVVVAAKVQENQPEGLVIMQPSPWAFALIKEMVPSQGRKVIIKPSKEKITSIKSLP
ncbi:MAG: molybdopterin dinucleotide binding domain-containing protein [Promethearchaeota archaeon]